MEKKLAEAYLGSDVGRILGNGQGADLVRRRNPLVERRGCAVPGQPGCFAVGRVTAAAVMLFLASVDDRDSIGEEDEGEDILRLRIVARVARRSVRGEKILD